MTTSRTVLAANEVITSDLLHRYGAPCTQRGRRYEASSPALSACALPRRLSTRDVASPEIPAALLRGRRWPVFARREREDARHGRPSCQEPRPVRRAGCELSARPGDDRRLANRDLCGAIDDPRDGAQARPRRRRRDRSVDVQVFRDGDVRPRGRPLRADVRRRRLYRGTFRRSSAGTGTSACSGSTRAPARFISSTSRGWCCGTA
jgi:hypothetical protein